MAIASESKPMTRLHQTKSKDGMTREQYMSKVWKPPKQGEDNYPSTRKKHFCKRGEVEDEESPAEKAHK